MIKVNRATITVAGATRELLDDLTVFRRKGIRDFGEFEKLYSVSSRGDAIATLPGFLERIMRHLEDYAVKDERQPMPDPDMSNAMKNVPAIFRGIVGDVIRAEGGVVNIPDIFGVAGFAAAIIRAYSHEELLMRGTPITVVAARDSRRARHLGRELKALIPDRELGVGFSTKSDDVIVLPYSSIKNIKMHQVGVFIGEVDELGSLKYATQVAEGVSSIRNAVRFGVISTSTGLMGGDEIDRAVEGMFGPLRGTASYKDAVDNGLGVPVTVCWLKCQHPATAWGTAPFRVLQSWALEKNKGTMSMIEKIMRLVPRDVGCIAYTSSDDFVKEMCNTCPGIPWTSKRMRQSERESVNNDIERGIKKKAVVSYGYGPFRSDIGVMVVATCEGRGVASVIPWRNLVNKGDRAYVVEFSHEWDCHNGRPGVIARNDETRRRMYSELGFRQISVPDVDQLPFL